ncbi:hypothetical protein GCM10027415_00590 [Humibacter ginsengisoli]
MVGLGADPLCPCVGEALGLGDGEDDVCGAGVAGAIGAVTDTGAAAPPASAEPEPPPADGAEGGAEFFGTGPPGAGVRVGAAAGA